MIKCSHQLHWSKREFLSLKYMLMWTSPFLCCVSLTSTPSWVYHCPSVLSYFTGSGVGVWGSTVNKSASKQATLLYSWRFSHYSAPIHWLVHGHMTSNNETVSRQMPWVSNTAKTMTSNGKQFTVTHEMLTAVARDQRWPDVVTGISVFNVSRDQVLGNIEILRKQNSLFPSGPVIKC